MFVPTANLGQTPAKMVINRVIGSNEEQEELNKMAHGVLDEQRSKEVFSSYQCRSLHKPDIKKHPGDIVEAGCLAAQPPPEAKYPLFDSLPTDVVSTGKLSDLQLEGVLYACQRHQIILPNEQRAGFFIGDGAGVGKGRQISGIILDNYARGRCKHIWFSISTDLKVDAQRDLNDIGCFIKVIEGCQQLDKETKYALHAPTLLLIVTIIFYNHY
ncbi:protein strawberry notch homolog 2-like [Actinia tenebrosa]|uniref:Protein strawberry notch homolog 2-like n=1 Tax=Actinia tenebrosa TaxID=6105 RepID=A0A6P8IIA6_ACTTE|nr:protein strawberry notch homolog 2-like [Actinia tenebrosa]